MGILDHGDVDGSGGARAVNLVGHHCFTSSDLTSYEILRADLVGRKKLLRVNWHDGDTGRAAEEFSIAETRPSSRTFLTLAVRHWAWVCGGVKPDVSKIGAMTRLKGFSAGSKQVEQACGEYRPLKLPLRPRTRFGRFQHDIQLFPEALSDAADNLTQSAPQ